MPKQKKQKYRSGEFWLEPPDNRYKSYRICRRNKLTRQADGFSIDTADFEVAKTKIQEHALKEGTGQKLKDEPVLTSMNRFYLKRAQLMASEETFSTAMADVQRILGSPMVSEMTAANQEKLIAGYRAEGRSDTTAVRRMTCIWASMRHAAKFEHITPHIIPARLSTKDWDAQGGKTKRLLSMQEMGKLLDAACTHFVKYPVPRLCRPTDKYCNFGVRWRDPTTGTGHRHSLGTADLEEAQKRHRKLCDELRSEHPDTWHLEYGYQWRFVLMLLATGGRSRAVADVCVPQVNFEDGILHLNAEGRKQTRKHRPTIPMAPILKQWLTTWVTEPLSPAGHINGYKGKPLRNGRYLFEYLSRQIGFKVSPHMIRHFVATHLSRSSHLSGLWERDMFMGWKRTREESSAMGPIYSHYDPRYLRGAALAIQAMLEELSKHTIGDLMKKGFDEQPLPEDAWLHAPSLSVTIPPNCMALWPARPLPMLESAQR